MPSKGTHDKNALTQNKQWIQIIGNGTGLVLVCNSVGEWPLEIDKIEREDKTRLSSGVINPFDFDIIIAAGDTEVRDYLLEWYEAGLDAGGESKGNSNAAGVDPNCYRSVIRTYHPHYAQTGNAGMKWEALGCWCSNHTIPEYNINGAEEATMTFSISANTAQRVKNVIQQAGAAAAAAVGRSGLAGAF